MNPALVLVACYGHPTSPDLTTNLLHYLSVLSMCRQALEVEEKCFGPNHLNVASALSNLAATLYHTVWDVVEDEFACAYVYATGTLFSWAV